MRIAYCPLPLPLIKTSRFLIKLVLSFDIMRNTNIRYWICQLSGWGLWILISMYFSLVTFSDRFEQGGKKEYLVSLCIYFCVGIILTHILRLIIRKANWARLSFNKTAVIFLVGVTATGTSLFYVDNLIEYNTAYSYDKFINKQRLEKAQRMEQQNGLSNSLYYADPTIAKDSAIAKAIADIKKSTTWYRNDKGEWKRENRTVTINIFNNLILISIWLLIYILYHYIEKNRNNQIDRLKLETTVKELELKTIKSHINPHFIFNSLNSIRALVDENPERARKAITELSNILRSSMQAEKSETVPLEKELDIVKDYLALEHMRFEERLKIVMDIDEDTLQQQVPPMMLQTLVENAIKHGISKQINGGTVKVVADFKENHLELLVQNTGQLSTNININGFGIKSTEDRLNLMYQGKATFEIKNIDGNMVQSKVIMPIEMRCFRQSWLFIRQHLMVMLI